MTQPIRARLVVAFLLLSWLVPPRPCAAFDVDYIDTSTAEWTRFLGWVDQALNGPDPYDFRAYHAAVAYRVTGDVRYAQLGIEMVDAEVQAANAAIAAGNRPSIAGDSYLEVGPHIQSLAAVYLWAQPLLTATQRQQWSAYAEQAIWNVWNHENAAWGGNPFPWSGWSVNDPGNNYYYSFTQATMYWAIATNSATWLNHLRNNKWPPLVAYFQNLPGGGSREGTGYGTSHRGLFANYRDWLRGTGENLADMSAHARDSIDYWIHVTVPAFDRIAPIGDHARDSEAWLFDYHRHLMLEAVNLYPNTPQAARGRWWLSNISVPRMQHGFNFIHDVLPKAGAQSAPTALSYHASGAGHFFSRSSWNRDATWMSFVCGIYDQSHAAQDQGAFSLYKDGWLAVRPNIFSHSGINQIVDSENTLRFRRNGATIGQNEGTTSTMNYSESNGVVTVNATLRPFRTTNDVQSWQRALTFGNNRLLVRDVYTAAAGVDAVFQVNTAHPPQAMPDGTIVAGGLTIRPIVPANPQINLVSWSQASGGEYSSGWKVELMGGTGEYQVELLTGPGAPPDGTPPAVPTGLQATPRDRRADLFWVANTDIDLAGYHVYRSNAQNGSYARVNADALTSAALIENGLTNGTVYWYRVTAVDLSGNESGPSAAVSVTPEASAGTPDPGDPPSPGVSDSPSGWEARVIPSRHLYATFPGAEAVDIYTVRGKKVAHVRGNIWRGLGDNGRPVPSGNYLFKTNTGREGLVVVAR